MEEAVVIPFPPTKEVELPKPTALHNLIYVGVEWRAGPWLAVSLWEKSSKWKNSKIKVLSPGSTENAL